MQKEQEFEMYISYQEWQYENQQLSEQDINKMEEELENLSPSNSIHYYPNKGESL